MGAGVAGGVCGVGCKYMEKIHALREFLREKPAQKNISMSVSGGGFAPSMALCSPIGRMVAGVEGVVA